jgi:tRNA nucleotidyltransferase (CCA-adding enzyme)
MSAINLEKKRKSIYLNVLKKITPSKAETTQEKKLVDEIKKKVKKLNGKHSHIEWCGSSARGTHLHNDRDLDLFLMFDKKLPEKELEEEGLRIAEQIFSGNKWEKAYSQHPYLRGQINGFDVEIVPSYIVSSGAEKQSAVDRTPFHNRYLLKKMNNKQRQDARLLKQFLKGIGAYGADLKNQSLPGYGAELLILYYKNFENVIKKISKWKDAQDIILEKRKRKAREDFCDPLIIIDPVDENRNVASALSIEKYNKMRFAAQKFLENPSEKFFFGEKNEVLPVKKIIEELAKREFIAIQADFPKNVLPDLMWGQLRRYLHKAANSLEEKDFVVRKTNLWSDESKVFFLYELDTLKLEKIKTVIGPMAKDVENVKKFLSKKRKIVSGPREESGRIVIDVERTEIYAKKVLQEFIKKCKEDEKQGIKDTLKKAEVLTEKDILKHYTGEFAQHFSRYLQGKESFE